MLKHISKTTESDINQFDQSIITQEIQGLYYRNICIIY